MSNVVVLVDLSMCFASNGNYTFQISVFHIYTAFSFKSKINMQVESEKLKWMFVSEDKIKTCCGFKDEL